MLELFIKKHKQSLLCVTLSSSRGMSHSRMDICRPLDQVLPMSPSTLVVESCQYVWIIKVFLSNQKAIMHVM